MTNICFVVTGLQYSTTSYMITVLGGEKSTIYYLFSGAALTGPAIGGISGGLITSKVLGGYTNKRAIYFCFFTFLALVVVSIPAPFIDNIYVYIMLIWLQLFCGGAIEPSLTGILLNTVNAVERPTASSFAIFFYNIFGYIPAPYFYGVIAEATKELDASGNNITRVPVQVLLFSTALGALSLLIAIMFRRRSQVKDFERLQASMAIYNPDLTADQIVNILADADNLDLDKAYNEQTSKDSRFQMSIK